MSVPACAMPIHHTNRRNVKAPPDRYIDTPDSNTGGKQVRDCNQKHQYHHQRQRQPGVPW